MEKAGRFVIRTSDGQAFACATHWEAWDQVMQLWRPGLTVSCFDTEARQRVAEEQAAAGRAKEKGTADG